jgi:hypothetical protein
LQLLGGEVVDLARDFAVDGAGIEHEHGVAAGLRFAFVEVPEFAGDGASVEKVGADGNHHVHIAGLDEFAADLGLAVAGAAGLRGHDEAGAAGGIEVAPEVGNPEVVSVGDLLVLVDAGEAEGEARVLLDLGGIDLVDVEGRVGHDEVAPAASSCSSA